MQPSSEALVVADQRVTVDPIVTGRTQTIQCDALVPHLGKYCQQCLQYAFILRGFRFPLKARQPSARVGRAAQYASVRLINVALDDRDDIRERLRSRHQQHYIGRDARCVGKNSQARSENKLGGKQPHSHCDRTQHRGAGVQGGFAEARQLAAAR